MTANLKFIIFLVCILSVDLAYSETNSQYVNWKIGVTKLGEIEINPYADPKWKIVNAFTERHFQLLSSPLTRVRIVLEPPKLQIKKAQIPFFFELIVKYPNGFHRSLYFISNLELDGDKYVNDYLVVNKELEYEVKPIDYRADQELIKVLDSDNSAAFQTKVNLDFTANNNFYELIEEYSTCRGDSFLYTYYGFEESTLSRKSIDSCYQKKGIYILDQRDWLSYYSLAYQLDKKQIPYYVVLKNDLNILQSGRNPSHVKLFSPDEETAMLTSATVTLDSFSGDDWVFSVKGKQAVKELKKLILEDLISGQYRVLNLKENIEVFSSGTPWKRKIDTSNSTEIERAERPYDNMILEDLRSAKSFVTFYNPALINIGNHNYDYDQLYKLLLGLTDRNVFVNIISSYSGHSDDFRVKKLIDSGKFHNIIPYYSFDKVRTIGTVHTRLINIDARICYLFTGHMANVYTNELGIRIEDSVYCSQIKNHLENLFGKTDLEEELNLIGLGILKLFRIKSRHTSSRAYDFIVNGKEKTFIDLKKLQPN